MTGDVFILQDVSGTLTWVDAFTAWGINIEDGALSALMTPPPMKEFIEGKSRLQHGSRVITKAPKYDSRTINLPLHIVASSKADFFTKYEAFCDDVLSKGEFYLRTKYQASTVYHLVYVSCTQYSQYQREMAKFTLRVTEPNPTDRTSEVPFNSAS